MRFLTFFPAANLSPDAFGNWICFWSVLPLALIVGFWLVRDWAREKLKERRETAEEAKVKGQKTSKEQHQNAGETRDEFRLDEYAEMTEVPDSMQILISRGDNPSGPYTPNQVNEYLKEGLLLPGDLASHEELDEWIPLSQLIENLKPEHLQQKSPPRVPSVDSYKTQQMGIKELIGENVSGQRIWFWSMFGLKVLGGWH